MLTPRSRLLTFGAVSRFIYASPYYGNFHGMPNLESEREAGRAPPEAQAIPPYGLRAELPQSNSSWILRQGRKDGGLKRRILRPAPRRL